MANSFHLTEEFITPPFCRKERVQNYINADNTYTLTITTVLNQETGEFIEDQDYSNRESCKISLRPVNEKTHYTFMINHLTKNGAPESRGCISICDGVFGEMFVIQDVKNPGEKMNKALNALYEADEIVRKTFPGYFITNVHPV